MSAGIRLESMSTELFLASTVQAALIARQRNPTTGATIREMVAQLDADEYWAGKFAGYTPAQKRAYVRRKMQTVRDEKGRRVFYHFRERR
jgi:hypothetical protein